MCYEEHLLTGYPVVSNNHLRFEGFKHFDVAWFVEQMQGGTELEDCLMLWDEIYQMMDSRSSGTKLNKASSYYVVQTRKRGVDLYVCTHHIENVDVRLRRAIDVRGASRYFEQVCKKCKCKTCKGAGRLPHANGSHLEPTCPDCSGVGGTGVVNGKTCDLCMGYGKLGWIVVSFLDRRLRRRYTSELFPYFNGDLLGERMNPGAIFCNKYWGLFDTREKMPIQAKLLRGIDTEVFV
jgi:hypothetical protein